MEKYFRTKNDRQTTNPHPHIMVFFTYIQKLARTTCQTLKNCSTPVCICFYMSKNLELARLLNGLHFWNEESIHIVSSPYPETVIQCATPVSNKAPTLNDVGVLHGQHLPPTRLPLCMMLVSLMGNTCPRQASRSA